MVTARDDMAQVLSTGARGPIVQCCRPPFCEPRRNISRSVEGGGRGTSGWCDAGLNDHARHSLREGSWTTALPTYVRLIPPSWVLIARPWRTALRSCVSIPLVSKERPPTPPGTRRTRSVHPRSLPRAQEAALDLFDRNSRGIPRREWRIRESPGQLAVVGHVLLDRRQVRRQQVTALVPAGASPSCDRVF